MYEELVETLRETTDKRMHEAADAIEELSRAAEVNTKRALKWAADAEKAEEKFRWIPVAERLPDNGDYVLVCIHSRWNKEICIPLVAYYDRFCSQWKLSWDNSDIYNITHWMPLPKPPKGE